MNTFKYDPKLSETRFLMSSLSSKSDMHPLDSLLAVQHRSLKSNETARFEERPRFVALSFYVHFDELAVDIPTPPKYIRRGTKTQKFPMHDPERMTSQISRMPAQSSWGLWRGRSSSCWKCTPPHPPTGHKLTPTHPPHSSWCSQGVFCGPGQ